MTSELNAAKNYDRGMWALERFSLFSLRREVLADSRGAILEIGAGTGANLSLYHPDSDVTAIDLRPAHLYAAANKARQTIHNQGIILTCADAHHLPFLDQAFDTVVGTLVFCSIQHPDQALAEIRRVLRPGGRLLLLEHVRGQTPITKRLTDWLHPLWFAMQGSCHLNRDTAATVAEAGFQIYHTSIHGKGLLQIIKATSLDV